ncbi:hypothetical protein EDC65_3869 [Stella humosa]|uniref:DUF5666 domain-containing protein n=1 Tax=Stella humosa TaxID=94 RepID=A0A3N1L557_9PROT|nr:DUF6152 family protein [Stella humosa]ROP84515.1 hypothetical protein EDC65_3869 [Stella humosa]BBK34035.1 hypothetical protein STHU_46690 [Stella humosa]
MRAIPSRAAALSAATVAILALATPLAAHHGWGAYDAAKQLELAGTVKEISYDNPHGTMRLEVPGKTWTVILAPPSRMRSRGLTPEMVAVGRQVTVVGYPHRTDEQELRAERVVAEGKTVELR